MCDLIHLRSLGVEAEREVILSLTHLNNYAICERNGSTCAVSVFADRETAMGYAATILDPDSSKAHEFIEAHRDP